MWAAIGTLITALGGIFVAVITTRTRKENSSQHAASQAVVKELVETVKTLDGKFDGHILWHLDTKGKGAK
jgi:uncharacterized YccA/Bax inhibitor family protein